MPLITSGDDDDTDVGDDVDGRRGARMMGVPVWIIGVRIGGGTADDSKRGTEDRYAFNLNIV